MSALLDSLAGPERRLACRRYHRHVVCELATRIAGIPCRVEVTHYLRVKPWRGSVHTCPSSDDYYGYTECDFDVVDRRGRPAPWLAQKITEADRRRIEGEVSECMESRE